MVAVVAQELAQGLIIHIDPSTIVNAGGAETNAAAQAVKRLQ